MKYLKPGSKVPGLLKFIETSANVAQGGGGFAHFNTEREAYRYMIDHSYVNGQWTREVVCVLVKNGVIVLPYNKNTTMGGTVSDYVVDGKVLGQKILAIGHTHPQNGGLSDWQENIYGEDSGDMYISYKYGVKIYSIGPEFSHWGYSKGRNAPIRPLDINHPLKPPIFIPTSDIFKVDNYFKTLFNFK